MTAQTGPAEQRASASLGERITQRVFSLSLVPVVVLLGLLLVAAIGAVIAGTQQPDVRATAIDAEADRARLLMRSVEGEISERTNDLSDWGRAPAVSGALRANYDDAEEMATWPSNFIATRRDGSEPLDESGASSSALAGFVEDSPFADGFATDPNGFLVATTDSTIDFAHGEEPWWLDAWTNGQSIGAPLTDAGAELVLVAVRIDDASGRPVGVTAGHMSTEGLQQLAGDVANGDDVDAWVVGPTGRLLAETASGHDASRIGQTVTFEPPLDELEQAATDGDEPTGSLGTETLIGGFGRADADSPISGWLVLTANGAPPASSAPVPLIPTLIAVAVALALAAAACWWYLRREARAVANEIVEPLQALRSEADRLATQELPDLVSSIRTTDGSGELPAVDLIEIDADGEVAELADAFNTLRLTAIDLAATQALDHSRDLATALVNLGRRNQQIIGRQLRFLEDWERTESDPDVLRQLFAVDQLATRMRRNAENLLVLAGERVPRRADQPEPIQDVIRAAASEIEDFARVELGAVESAMIEPSLVSDLTHLLAELIENAARFSPTSLPVEVLGAWGDRSNYTVSVVDRGPGMSRTLLAEANARIDQTASEETATGYLGLYVVGRLAARHDLDARLVESTTVGITAKVTLPERCVSKPSPAIGAPDSMAVPMASTPSLPASPSRLGEAVPSIQSADPEPVRVDHPAAFIVRTPSTIITGEHPAIVIPGPGEPLPIDLPISMPAADAQSHLNWPPPVVPGQARPDALDDADAVDLIESEAASSAEAELELDGEVDLEGDESNGAPIPPFQTRRSRRRPVESTTIEPTTPDLDLRGPHLVDDAADEVDLTTDDVDLQPTVDSHPATAGLTPPSPSPHLALVTDDEPDAEERAAEVRSQLSRFTEGVAAAKAIVAGPTAPDAASLLAGLAGPPAPEQPEVFGPPSPDVESAGAEIEPNADVAAAAETEAETSLIEDEAMPESVVDDSDEADTDVAPALDLPTAVIDVGHDGESSAESAAQPDGDSSPAVSETETETDSESGDDAATAEVADAEEGKPEPDPAEATEVMADDAEGTDTAEVVADDNAQGDDTDASPNDAEPADAGEDTAADEEADEIPSAESAAEPSDDQPETDVIPLNGNGMLADGPNGNGSNGNDTNGNGSNGDNGTGMTNGAGGDTNEAAEAVETVDSEGQTTAAAQATP